MVGTRSEGQSECSSVEMKVLASDGAKLVINDEKGAEEMNLPRRQLFTMDHDFQPPRVPMTYVSFSKFVLLVLAIIATFLACLIFARDLWGLKNAENQEMILQPQHLKHQPEIDSPLDFPFEDNLLNDFPEFPFSKLDTHQNKDKEDPKVITTTTKITFHVDPSDGSTHKRTEIKKTGSTSGLDNPLEDVIKMMMNIMDEEQPRPSAKWEKPSMFSDLPMFNHQPQNIHPKLILVRRIRPSSTPVPIRGDDIIQNIFNGGLPISKMSKINANTPYPLISINQSGRSVPSETVLPPTVNVDVPGVRNTPFIVKAKTEGSVEDWRSYRELIENMASSVDSLLEVTTTLKESVKKEIIKLEDNITTPKDTTENTTQNSETDSTSTEDSSTKIKNILSEKRDCLDKIEVALTDSSILIKTEDGALDLVTRTDKEGLSKAIDSFIKAIRPPLDRVYETSMKLTKTDGNEKEISEGIYSGIVKLGNGLIKFGKLIYEDLVALRRSLDGPTDVNQKTVNDTNQEPKLTQDPLGMPFFPLVRRKVIFFNGPRISSIIPTRPESNSEEKYK